jgi:hypothetical protein
MMKRIAAISYPQRLQNRRPCNLEMIVQAKHRRHKEWNGAAHALILEVIRSIEILVHLVGGRRVPTDRIFFMSSGFRHVAGRLVRVRL